MRRLQGPEGPSPLGPAHPQRAPHDRTEPDPGERFILILLAHNTPVDVGFLATALTRLGIACPPHDLFDTLELARQLYPIWPSHSLENIAIRLHVAGGREHRALPDARLVKDVFLELLQRTPTVKSIADLVHISSPLTFADAPTASNPPQGLCASRTSCPIETGESCDLLRLPGDEDACHGAIYFSRTSS